MDWKMEWKYLAAGAVIFLAFFYLPVGNAKFEGALLEAVYLTSDYAREHVLLCLLPAFFIRSEEHKS